MQGLCKRRWNTRGYDAHLFGVISTPDSCCMLHPMQDADADVIAKLLDEAMVPTAEYVAGLESAVASATQELAFREDAAARREAESKVCPMTVMHSCLLRSICIGHCLKPACHAHASTKQWCLRAAGDRGKEEARGLGTGGAEKRHC